MQCILNLQIKATLRGNTKDNNTKLNYDILYIMYIFNVSKSATL